MKETIKEKMKGLATIADDLDIVSNENLDHICEAALRQEQVTFETPDGSHPLDTNSTLQILGLIAQYIALGLTIWQTKVQQVQQQGPKVTPEALDKQITSGKPELSTIPEKTRTEAAASIIQHE